MGFRRRQVDDLGRRGGGGRGLGAGRPPVEGTPAGHRNGDVGFSPIPVGMAIFSDGKFPVTPYKSHPGSHRHKVWVGAVPQS